MDIVSDTAFEMKGLATVVFVPCDDAKKMCKKLKVSPPPVMIKHYKYVVPFHSLAPYQIRAAWFVMYCRDL